MTVGYSLGPNPKWYFVDLTGKPLGGGFLATQSNLNPNNIKLVYQTASNSIPHTYIPIPNQGTSLGISIDENGTQGPFYFAFDPANPTDTYFLQVFDKTGQPQWQISNYIPSGTGGGGGGPVTNVYNLENLITNPVMWRHGGTLSTPVPMFAKIAPGAHAGLAQTASNAGPDTCFIKNNLNASDTLSFPKFTLGDTFFGPNEVTPVDSFNYNCGNSPSGETFKFVQFPITRNVQNLTGLTVTVTIWAKTGGGTGALTLQWRQFFGDGGAASPDVISIIDTLALTTGWVRYTKTIAVPSVVGKSLGQCGNDALFLQVAFPLGVPCNISFTLPAVFIGINASNTVYQPYDEIDGVINAPRTGYVFPSYDLVAPFGYLKMDDGSIGNSNVDYFPLYNWLWTNVSSPSANTLCIVAGGLGASAVADFAAGKTMQLPKTLGRAICEAGTGAGLSARPLASIDGFETHFQSESEMARHNHHVTDIEGQPFGVYGSPTTAGSGGPITQLSQPPSGINANSLGLPHDPPGAQVAFNIMQPSTFMNYYIKL